MPLRGGTFSFPEISFRTFKGLPGMLADSLPDKYGHQLIDRHLASRGLDPQSITAIDRLLYVGRRGMGALEYEPTQDLAEEEALGGYLDLEELTELANAVLARDQDLADKLKDARNQQAAFTLLRVGRSAGGARAKALVALEDTGDDTQILPKMGHVDQGPGHSYWLLKFDGVQENSDRDSADPPGSTVVEYVYSLMAKQCDIHMPRCRLLEQGEQRHFLIERFDRFQRGEKLDKLHFSSWCGMDHIHRDTVGSFSYEQLVMAMRRLDLPQSQVAELFRRAVFNVIGRNQDDHSKNFGFLMDREGRWSLSPAYDLTYSYDPSGSWTRQHQISFNGKTKDFSREDLLSFGKTCNLSTKESGKIVDKTLDAFSRWDKLAMEHEVPEAFRKTVASHLRLKL